jgi:hypothetical protein
VSPLLHVTHRPPRQMFVLLKDHPKNRAAAERLGYKVRSITPDGEVELPVGTLDQLVAHYVAPRVRDLCGALPLRSSPCLVSGAGSCRCDQVWLVDMTPVGAIHTCAHDGCSQAPSSLTAKLCDAHTEQQQQQEGGEGEEEEQEEQQQLVPHAPAGQAQGRQRKRQRTERDPDAEVPAAPGSGPGLASGAAQQEAALAEMLGTAAAVEVTGSMYSRRPPQPAPVVAHYKGEALLLQVAWCFDGLHQLIRVSGAAYACMHEFTGAGV